MFKEFKVLTNMISIKQKEMVVEIKMFLRSILKVKIKARKRGIKNDSSWVILAWVMLLG